MNLGGTIIIHKLKEEGIVMARNHRYKYAVVGAVASPVRMYPKK